MAPSFLTKSDTDLQVQAKILKAIEEKTFRRLGDNRNRSVAFRLIGATHRNLEELMHSGRFREDLYFRISTIQLTMPALRDRREDIPLLARLILAQVATQWGIEPLQLSTRAEARLSEQDWPGNIRELRNAIQGSILTRRGPIIDVDDLGSRGVLPAPQTESGDGTRWEAPGLTLMEVERRHILRVMKEMGSQVDAAAVALGIHRNTLYVKLKNYGISTSRIAK